MTTAENLTGNLPNKVNGEYQRPQARDFEDATIGDVSWKDETGTYKWDAMPVLPAGIFASFDSSITAPADGVIYIGNGDTTTVTGWDGAGRYDWVRYTADTSLWSSISPTEGQLCYDTSADVWNTFDTTASGWLEMQTTIGTTSYTKATVDMGDWNMDTTAGITVNHGLSATEWKTVRNIHALIRDDSDGNHRPLNRGTSAGVMDGYIANITATQFQLSRVASGSFDNTDHDSTSYNRGWVTYEYIKD